VRKIVDSSGRLFGKISLIDIVVIIAAAVTVLAAYAKHNVVGGPTVSVSTIPVQYKVMIRAIRDTSADLFREGDSLFSDSGFDIGVISGKEVSDAVSTTNLADGTYVEARVADRYDVELTVDVQCSYSAGRYYANRSFELAQNSEQKCHTKYVDVTGTISSVAAKSTADARE
jgi:hypothetical protein